MSQSLLTPRLHLDSPTPSPGLLRALSDGLSRIQEAAPGDIVGFAAAHCLPRAGLPRPVSEVMCTFQRGKDRCEATILHPSPKARKEIEVIEALFDSSPSIAKLIHEAAASPCVQIDTKHFSACTIMVCHKRIGPPAKDLEVGIYARSAETREAAEALEAEIRMAFDLVAEDYSYFSGVRFRLPDRHALIRRARELS